MTLPFSLKQKVKIAIFLFCIMISIILIRILEDKSLENVDQAFSSIYNDRLIPATDLFQISEEVYAKRHLIEAYFEPNSIVIAGSTLPKKLAYFNTRIDSLLLKYEKTYLVAQEKDGLTALKSKLVQIRTLEKELTSSSKHLPEIKTSFLAASVCLANLTKIQSNVGEQLIKNTQKELLSSKLYSTAQFALAVLIGILILSILLTANAFKIKSTGFSLN